MDRQLRDISFLNTFITTGIDCSDFINDLPPIATKVKPIFYASFFTAFAYRHLTQFTVVCKNTDILVKLQLLFKNISSINFSLDAKEGANVFIDIDNITDCSSREYTDKVYKFKLVKAMVPKVPTNIGAIRFLKNGEYYTESTGKVEGFICGLKLVPLTEDALDMRGDTPVYNIIGELLLLDDELNKLNIPYSSPINNLRAQQEYIVTCLRESESILFEYSQYISDVIGERDLMKIINLNNA